jgi:hypothetical protein
MVTETVIVALISASGSVAVAVTALALNFRLFHSLERRIEVIESDLKNFYRDLAGHDKRLSGLEAKQAMLSNQLLCATLAN